MSEHPRPRRTLVRSTALAAAATMVLAGATLTTASADQKRDQGRDGPHRQTAPWFDTGFGGAVVSVDENATRIGQEVLRKGGNAVDAAVATAAALGVTEPYSAGIGGGGYFVYYDADDEKVYTLDGRETAPEDMPRDAFIDPATGEPYNFFPERVTSGASVGVPGTLATWEEALDRWGSKSLRKLLRPSIELADEGFEVDETFRLQTAENAERFAAFTSTSELFLPGGAPPAVGTVLENDDLAETYRLIAEEGTDVFYEGEIAEEIAEAVQDPPTTDTTDLPVPPGFITVEDLDDYEVIKRAPTHVRYRGYDVYGMAPSSSGGSTVGEALNIMEEFDLDDATDAVALHHYLEATALAFADRNAYVGDPDFVDVPLEELLDQDFAEERACLIDPEQALAKPVAAGEPDGEYAECPHLDDDEKGRKHRDRSKSTTNLTVADRWGNVVEYTLTIEQTGGSGIVVPGRGFILNNELTDFSAEYDEDDPNRIEPGKRPRSSMSPTIVLRKGEPFLALGTPGGSTIITTVTQIIFNRIDRDMSLAEAVAAPRASQRNTETVLAEQAFIDAYGEALGELGHELAVAGEPGTSAAQIGAATAIEIRKDGRMIAVAEPVRRGGGSAMALPHRHGKSRHGDRDGHHHGDRDDDRGGKHHHGDRDGHHHGDRDGHHKHRR